MFCITKTIISSVSFLPIYCYLRFAFFFYKAEKLYFSRRISFIFVLFQCRMTHFLILIFTSFTLAYIFCNSKVLNYFMLMFRLFDHTVTACCIIVITLYSVFIFRSSTQEKGFLFILYVLILFILLS